MAAKPRPPALAEREVMPRMPFPTNDDFPTDWSAHALRPGADLLYLAEAAAIAGSILCWPWKAGDRLTWAAPRPAVVLPSVEQAYDAEGRPVADLHADYGIIVRQHAATGSFDPADHLDPRLLGSGPIDMEDWLEASIDGWTDVDMHRCARRTATVVADVIALAARTGEIRTWVRRSGGGAPMIAPPEHAWDLDAPIWRLASCGLRFDAPGDVRAVPDHLVFVDPTGFEQAIRRHLPTHYRPLVRELEGEPPFETGVSVTAKRNRLTAAMVEIVLAEDARASSAARDEALAAGDTDEGAAAAAERARLEARRRWNRSRLTEALRSAGHVGFPQQRFEDARRNAIGKIGELAPRGRQPGGRG